MSDDDFSATARIQLRWLLPFRNYLTPSALWAAIVALAIAIGYVVHAQVNLNSHQESIDELKKSIAKLVEQSQDTRTDVASIKATVGDMKDEQDHQRERWERIDSVAESPPHARRRK